MGQTFSGMSDSNQNNQEDNNLDPIESQEQEQEQEEEQEQEQNRQNSSSRSNSNLGPNTRTSGRGGPIRTNFTSRQASANASHPYLNNTANARAELLNDFFQALRHRTSESENNRTSGTQPTRERPVRTTRASASAAAARVPRFGEVVMPRSRQIITPVRPTPPSGTQPVLTRILTAAANAITLTAQEHQRRSAEGSGESSLNARTATSFMDSFMNHLQEVTDTSTEPFPRLSLINETNENTDNSTGLFRVFRMHSANEPTENNEGEANGEANSQTEASTTTEGRERSQSQPGSTPSTTPVDPNQPVPVLIIGIRSVINQGGNGSTQTGSNNDTPNQQESTAEPRSQADISDPLQNTTTSPEQNSNNATNSNGTQPIRRSWIIYVVGSNYPANHPFLTTALSENPSYEDLLNLSAFLGPARPPTTTQEQIDLQLREVIYDESLPEKKGIAILNGNQCQVCLTEYEYKDKLRLLKCQHAFHTACIDKWLTTGSNNCPICRREATVKDYKPESEDQDEQQDGSSYVSLMPGNSGNN